MAYTLDIKFEVWGREMADGKTFYHLSYLAGKQRRWVTSEGSRHQKKVFYTEAEARNWVDTLRADIEAQTEVRRWMIEEI